MVVVQLLITQLVHWYQVPVSKHKLQEGRTSSCSEEFLTNSSNYPKDFVLQVSAVANEPRDALRHAHRVVNTGGRSV